MTNTASETARERYPYDKLKAARDFARATIEYEGSLINNRISWLVAGQSFLLGTYALLLNSPTLHMDHPGNAVPLPTGGGTYNALKMMTQIEQLRFWFAYTGIILASLTTVAVFAGYTAILRRNEAFMLNAYAEAGAEVRQMIEPPLAGASRRILGQVALVVGPLFALVWAGILWSGDILQRISSDTFYLSVIGTGGLLVVWYWFIVRFTPTQELPPHNQLLKHLLRLYNRRRKHTVLIVGKGALGTRVKRRLADMGHRVSFFDPRTEKGDLVDDDNRPKWDYEQLVKTAEVLLVFVEGDEEVKSVVETCYEHGIEKTCTIINHSTVSVTAAIEIGRRCRELGYSYIEMPVSGGTRGAEGGSLSAFYYPGPDGQGTYVRSLPFIKCYCDTSKCIRFCQFGEPAKYKLVNQIGIAGALLGVIESLAAAEMMKLNQERALEVLRSGAAESWSMKHHGHQIVYGQYSRDGISVKNFRKDLGYVMKEIECATQLAGVSEVASLLDQRARKGDDSKVMASSSIYLELLERLRETAPKPAGLASADLDI